MVRTCPRCGQVEELSADSPGGQPGFWSEPLCAACRAALGATPADRLGLAVGWLAMPVETLLDIAEGIGGQQVRP